MSRLNDFYIKYFISDELPIESRTLNFACFFSAIAGTAALVSRIIAGLTFLSMASLLIMIAAIFLVFAISIRKPDLANKLTVLIVIGVSVIFWPLHFFTIGGPSSGMAVYFAMAILLDFMLLKGKPRIFVLILTCVVAFFCYYSTMFLGWNVFPEGGLNDYQLFVDIMQSILIVGILMGAIVLYQTRLYQNEKNKTEQANKEIKSSEALITYLNEASVNLLTADPEHFDDILTGSMEKIAGHLGIDCIYIWRAAEREGEPVYEKLYSMCTTRVCDIKTVEEISGSNTIKRVPELDDYLLSEKGYVSDTANFFTGYVKEVFSAFEIKAITAFPVFFRDGYWGFVSFDNRHDETLCNEREVSILRSASILLANSVERNESMLKLKAAQLTMSEMFEANPHINILFDSRFNVIDCNKAALSFIGFETKEELRAGVMERLSKAIPEFQSSGRRSVPLAERFVTTITEGFVRFTTELIIEGAERNIDVEFRKIPYEDSFAIVAYIIDMTDIHRREMELKKAHEQNERQLDELNAAVNALETAQKTVSAMFEANPHINVLFDSEFRVLDCNPAAVRFMGFESKEELVVGFYQRLLDSIPEALVSGREKRSVQEWVQTAVKEGYVSIDTEFILGGSRRSVEIELKTIPYGDSFAIVAYILDMTEVRERENELRKRDQQLSEAVEEARAANEAKSVFLSTMSHEIRTPMNAILGITEILLQNDELVPDTKEGLGKIYTSGDMLLGIINDILDLSKIEAGRLELVIDKYEIASLVSDTAQLNMMRIGSKPIEFELYIDENTPSVLMGDELRVKQIMNNILSNAFKYTTAGKVTLTINIEPVGGRDDEVLLIINISDTGQGMTKEQISQLFEEYARFNMDANRTTEGTGLGMSITKNLLKLMDGDISVDSEPGKGSTFTIQLRQGRVGTSVLGKEMADNLHNFRTSSRTQMKRVQISRDPMPYGKVLIVDDVETNIYVARGLMLPYELKIDAVDSGFAAIELVKSGSEYDIIFMDHMMPKMDGVEATKIIRDHGYDKPIVALTANAVAGQADIFLGNGFNDYISKPIDIRQLNNVLNKLIRDKYPEEVVQAARKQSEESKGSEKTDEESKPKTHGVDPKFAEIFIRDANKSLAVLDAIEEKGSYDIDEDLRTYTIHVHGLKSALANIGNMELSAIALKLESTARDNDIETIMTDNPGFLKKLKAYTGDLAKELGDGDSGAPEGDLGFLSEKLLAIKAACEDYDEGAADDAISELKKNSWPQPVSELLSAIAEYLLHSDFDLAVDDINKYMEAL